MENQRRFKRVVFSGNSRPKAVLCIPNHAQSKVEADIMNLSEGGFFLAIDRNLGVKSGDHLFLVKILGTDPAFTAEDIEIEVKWTVADHYLDYKGIGCEFLNTPSQVQEELQDLVNALSAPAV